MIYFDNSATTKPYEEVLDAYLAVNRKYYGNPSSLHNFGGKAEQLIINAREQIANLLHVKPTELIFTSGGSESNNLAIKGIAHQYHERGRHIITTEVEHPSVSNPYRQLEELGFQVTRLPVDKNGIINLDELKAALTDKTILVSIIHVNNEVGIVQPIKEIGEIINHYPKAFFHVDHVQGAGKIPFYPHEAHVDLCSFSAHKFHGLKGNGILFKRNGIQLETQISGGNQEQKFRSGTENVGGIVAMAKALRIAEENRVHKGKKLLQMRDYLLDQLELIPEIIIHTAKPYAAPHIINFTAVGLKGEVIVHALEEAGVIVSTTSACSSKEKSPSSTLKAMGISDEMSLGAIRVSLSYENTLDEAVTFIQELKQILTRLYSVVRRNK